MNKAPGIYSARWGGKNADFKKAIKKVYRELNKKDKNWKNKIIKARFICALSIYFLDKKTICVRGKVEGTISPEPKGKMVLVMIQFLSQLVKNILLVKFLP